MAQYASDISAGNPLTRNGSISLNDTVTLEPIPGNVGEQSLQVVLSNGVYYADFGDVPNKIVNTNAATDFEFLVLNRITHPSGNPVVEIQVQNAASTDGFYAWTSRNNALLRLGGDSETNVNLGFTIPNGADHWIRLRKRGNQIHAQAWLFGDPEPAGEAISQTHTKNFTAANWVWVCRSTSGTGNGTFHLDYIAVGTEGDPAPRSKLQDYYVRDGGVWKPVDTLSVRDGGIWKECEYSVRDGGVWKKVYG